MVHVPPSYDGTKPVAAILIFHGGGGNGEAMRPLTLMDESSDKYGFLAVYPDGSGNQVLGKTFGSWNAGNCCPKASQEGVDDVGFISKLIDQLKADFKIDEKRVYTTGHSNGAQISFRLACELSDKIAAIAPSGAQGVFDECHPKRPVPVLYFHGTEDHCSEYKGGETGGCFDDALKKILPSQRKAYTWKVEAAPQYIESWRKRNGASERSEVIYRRGGATCTSWGKGTEKEVVFCKIEGMGHTWPGGTYGKICERNPEGKICKVMMETVGKLSSDISANDMMWEFFSRHPYPN